MKNIVIKLFYSLLFLPLALIRIVFKSYKNPKYLNRLHERFAIFKTMQNCSYDLWMHTVSVGEFLAAKVLINELVTKNPDIKLLITTTTPTGSELVQKYISEQSVRGASNISHFYYPYDVGFICRRFLRKIKPKQVVFFETEIWPKMFAQIKKQNIKLYIINARLSEKSYKGYAQIKELINAAINKVDFIAAQGQDDKQRFVELGYKDSNIEVFGNIKYNLKLPEDLTIRSEQCKLVFGIGRPILIAASTHHGEEELILDIYKKVRKKFKNLLLIIAPRHPERFEEVFSMCLNENIRVAKYTELNIDSNTDDNIYSNTEILVLDTIGQLLYFYNISDLAFIGGSFADIGGHNPIEAAVLKVPTIIGPNYYNFTEIVQDLEQNKGIIVVNNAQNLENTIINLLNNVELSKKIGLAACDSLRKHQGILEKYLRLIQFS